MGFLSVIFDPPETRKHRKAAHGAAALRQQAARDLHIELQVLMPFFRAAAVRHQRAVAAGNLSVAGRFAEVLEVADELLERLKRTSPGIEAEVSAQRGAASTAADWERYATFELELRAGFLQLREQVKGHTATLTRMNREADELLALGNAPHRTAMESEPYTFAHTPLGWIVARTADRHVAYLGGGPLTCLHCPTRELAAAWVRMFERGEAGEVEWLSPRDHANAAMASSDTLGNYDF